MSHGERYNLEKISGRGLSVIECGFLKCDSGHTIGSRIYGSYSATFIIDGKGTYTTCGKTYELEKGQGFIITPGVANSYTADSEHPWKYIFVAFKGHDSEALLHNAGLNTENPVFSFPTDEETLSHLFRIHSAGKNLDTKGYDALGYFYIVISNLVADFNSKHHYNRSSEYYVRRALSYIDDHFTSNISVADVAEFVRIDRSHLFRLFIKHVGLSPSKYLTNIRLKRSVSLMENKELSVNEIAISSGFYDFSHFSRVFSSVYGMSPGKYRKLNYDI